MKIVFVGAVEFSRHCLEAVIANGGNVVAVVTLVPDLAHRHADYANLAPVASEHGIPVYYVDKLNDHLTLIQSLNPDVMLVFGWSQLLSKEVLSVARMGCIGTHPALLPRNRGRHPLIWALVEGLVESGLTFLYLDEGMDSGDILWQGRFDIILDDTAATLYQKINRLAVQAIAEFLPALMNGTAQAYPQDHTKATYWRKRTEADGLIDWGKPVLVTYNLIRALTKPYVGAHTFYHQQRMVIWSAQLTDKMRTNAQRAGEIMKVCENGSLEVVAGDNILHITKYMFLQDAPPLIVGTRLG